VAGYVAMAIGVVFSVLLGVGLMVLVFYSSRAGYDEPAKLIRSEGDKTQE
jgi:ABC-type Mn2+/Zn2+ transport system permease subunit